MLRYGILAAMAMLVATPAMAQAPACTPAVPDSELVKSRTLVMSTNPTLPPLQFVDAQGQLRGQGSQGRPPPPPARGAEGASKAHWPTRR